MFKTIALALCLCALPLVAQAEGMINYAQTDARMNAAKADARATLDRFFKARALGAGTDFWLKAAIPTASGNPEHIWTALTRIDGDQIEAVLLNEPSAFDGHLGDPITYTRAQISDWSYRRNGLLEGNYTTRVMLPDLDAETRAELSSQLAPLPNQD